MIISRTLIVALGTIGIATVPGAALAQSGEGIADAIERADRNNDGVVSKAEFVAYRASQFDRFDRNNDGYLSRADIPRFVRNPERFLSRVEPYDFNGDGRVSRAEYNRGPTIAFDRVDTDGDNRVTQNELAAAKRVLQQEYGR